MPLITMIFGALLIGLGLYGYTGIVGDKKSITALIPAFFGIHLILIGFIALLPKARKHAMHTAVLIGLIGALAALGRGLPKIGALISNDPNTNSRAVIMTLIMGTICLIYVGLCINSFIQARKRQKAAAATEQKPK